MATERQERNIVDLERLREEARVAFAESIDDLNSAIETATPLGVKQVTANKIKSYYKRVYIREAYVQKWYSLLIYIIIAFMLHFSFAENPLFRYAAALYPALFAFAAIYYFQGVFGLEYFFEYHADLGKNKNRGIITRVFLKDVFNRDILKVKSFETIIKKAIIACSVFAAFFLLFAGILKASALSLFFAGFFVYCVYLIAFNRDQV